MYLYKDILLIVVFIYLLFEDISTNQITIYLKHKNMSTYMQIQFNLNLITIALIKFKLLFTFDEETILESI